MTEETTSIVASRREMTRGSSVFLAFAGSADIEDGHSIRHRRSDIGDRPRTKREPAREIFFRREAFKGEPPMTLSSSNLQKALSAFVILFVLVAPAFALA